MLRYQREDNFVSLKKINWQDYFNLCEKSQFSNICQAVVFTNVVKECVYICKKCMIYLLVYNIKYLCCRIYHLRTDSMPDCL